MNFTIPTRYEEFTLQVSVKILTPTPQKIHITVKDADKENTVFTDRYTTIEKQDTFFVRMPASGNTAVIQIFNEKYGNRPKDQENTFEVTDIRKTPLEKKLDLIDFSDPLVRSFVKFCTKFCFNAGWLPADKYVSDDKKFTIIYEPTIISSNSGKELTTPARISQMTGRIQVSQKRMVGFTVPMRMAILLHEFSHFYLNTNMEDETEADKNGLLIYLGLGYPRIEGYEAFLKTFIEAPTPENKKRYDIINKFITDFEKQNFFIND
jgi:hypothetical protein